MNKTIATLVGQNSTARVRIERQSLIYAKCANGWSAFFVMDAGPYWLKPDILGTGHGSADYFPTEIIELDDDQYGINEHVYRTSHPVLTSEWNDMRGKFPDVEFYAFSQAFKRVVIDNTLPIMMTSPRDFPKERVAITLDYCLSLFIREALVAELEGGAK